MKWTDMHIARMVGGVSYDRVAAFSSEPSRLALADTVLQAIKQVLDNHGASPEIDAAIGVNAFEFKYPRNDTRHRVSVLNEGVQFDLGKFRPPDHVFDEMAEILEAVLETLNRKLWNEIGTMVGVALPSKSSEEEGRTAALFLKSLLAVASTPIANVFPADQDRVIDITVKGTVDHRNLTLNIYNTDDQTLVCTLDSKLNRREMKAPGIAPFLVAALDQYRDTCGGFLETLSEDPQLATLIDTEFLAKGSR